MTFTEHYNISQEPVTEREWQLSEEIDKLFITDAERVCAEQSNRKYRLMRNDVIRLIESYSDLPISRVLAILNFESELWTKA
jgi:hypothetical protein